jgi:hypothetical protein
VSARLYLNANKNITAYELFRRAWEWKYRVPLNQNGNVRILEDLAAWQGSSKTPPYVSDYLRNLLEQRTMLPQQAMP